MLLYYTKESWQLSFPHFLDNVSFMYETHKKDRHIQYMCVWCVNSQSQSVYQLMNDEILDKKETTVTNQAIINALFLLPLKFKRDDESN